MNTSGPTGKYIPQRAELISLVCAVMLVLLIAILSYHSWISLGARSDELSITQEIVDGTDDLLSSLKDAETGQRGFLLTGADRYLDPYRKAVVEIPITLKGLVDATQPSHPDQARQIEGLNPPIKDKLDELQKTIDLRRSKGLEAALAIVATDHGKAIMDQLRVRILEIQTVAYSRLKQYSKEANASAHQLGLISTLGSGALFILLVLSTVTIQKGTRRRQRLIQDLQESEAQTREARDLLQTTIGSIGDAVIATDAVGRVTFLNAVAELLTGWTQEESVRRPLEEIFVINNAETGTAGREPRQ
jgi:CHASE3 domain sensor protein